MLLAGSSRTWQHLHSNTVEQQQRKWQRTKQGGRTLCGGNYTCDGTCNPSREQVTNMGPGWCMHQNNQHRAGTRMLPRPV